MFYSYVKLIHNWSVKNYLSLTVVEGIDDLSWGTGALFTWVKPVVPSTILFTFDWTLIFLHAHAGVVVVIHFCWARANEEVRADFTTSSLITRVVRFERVKCLLIEVRNWCITITCIYRVLLNYRFSKLKWFTWVKSCDTDVRYAFTFLLWVKAEASSTSFLALDVGDAEASIPVSSHATWTLNFFTALSCTISITRPRPLY